MLKNFLKIAFRNLSRNKLYSSINIFGLAAGLAVCLLIMLYIFDELSYDRHQKDADRTYRLAYVKSNAEHSSAPYRAYSKRNTNHISPPISVCPCAIRALTPG